MYQNNFIQIFGITLLNSIWQMAILWSFYKVITSIFVDLKYSIKARFSAALIIGGFGWFIFNFFSTWNFESQSNNNLLFLNKYSLVDDSLFSQLISIAAIIYLIVLAVPLLNFIKSIRFVNLVRNTGLSKADFSFRLFVDRTAALMGIKKDINVFVSDLVNSPLTIGFIKPIILLPIAAINQLSTQQVEAILLHELSHIKRFDYFINLLVQFIKTILYFNPFVKLLVRELELEREKHCDELVLQFQYSAFDYASALLLIGKTAMIQNNIALPAVNHRSILFERVELILNKKPKHHYRVFRIVPFIIGISCLLFLNTFNFTGSQKLQRSKQHSNFTKYNTIPFPSAFSKYAVKENENTITYKTKKSFTQPEVKKIKAVTIKKIPTTSEYTPKSVNTDFINVLNIEPQKIPVLNTLQNYQVQNTVENSKKLIEQFEWNQIEKQIAEVLSEKEKDELKTIFKNRIANLDWSKLENKLKSDYTNIDWENINQKFEKSDLLNKADSIQTVYTNALINLDDIKLQLLSNNNNKSILTTIDNKKKELLIAIETIKAIKKGKIVHL